MIERLVLALVLLVYATGCASAIVELHRQWKEPPPLAVELRARHPVGHIIGMLLLVVGWPCWLVWWVVRDSFR